MQLLFFKFLKKKNNSFFVYLMHFGMKDDADMFS